MVLGEIFMNRLIGITILVGGLLSIIPFLIEKYSKGNKKSKYFIPAMAFLLAIIMLIMAKWFSTGMQDLADIIMAIISGGAGIMTLIACIITDKLYKNRSRSKN